MKDFIKEFNTKDSLLVITSYPDKSGEGAKQNAVACYSQNLFSAYRNRKIIVLSDITSHSKSYKDGNLVIIPCWKPGSINLFTQILKTLFKFNEVRDLLIQFEFNMLGSVFLTSLFPFFLGFLKLLGKNVILVQHQVIDDLSILSGHLNIKPNTFKNSILNFGLHYFYIFCGIFSNSIIVHEEILKEGLSKWIDKDEIFVVPHGLSQDTLPLRKNKEFTLLLFGYLSWYKGVDWLIKKIGEIRRKHPEVKMRLVVAGGPSATLKSKPHYLRFIKEVNKLARNEKEVVDMTGYIPENQVKRYFSHASVVILPYRALMSASGPLSFALRFGKPFMVSRALSQVLPGSDLTGKIVFDLNGNDFEKKLLKIYKDKKLYSELAQYSKGLGATRDWKNIVAAYESVIRTETALQPIAALDAI